MSDEIKDEVELEEETTELEEKIITDNDEIKEFNQTVLGQPENPLVVHKKGDASYEDAASLNQMNETHTEEERPTLTRHRFRKEQKSHGKSIALLFVLVILAALVAGLYFTGNLSFGTKEDTTKKKAATTEVSTSIQDKYKGTIVVKDVYIFVDGYEVKGIEGLQKALEYEDASTTAYKIIDENANPDFLNYEVLELLTSLKFYGNDTEIEHIASTGLIAEAETTTLPPETTTAAETTAGAETTIQQEIATE
ncbi:MAG: hypothetical protein IKF64_04680 [Eubacterium sp.]|nr:hypothetical protein [Eubacterium sp.]